MPIRIADSYQQSTAPGPEVNTEAAEAAVIRDERDNISATFTEGPDTSS
jgi:hypothetical protein